MVDLWIWESMDVLTPWSRCGDDIQEHQQQKSEPLQLPGKNTTNFPRGATPPRTPPSGPAGAGRVGVITRGGTVDPF